MRASIDVAGGSLARDHGSIRPDPSCRRERLASAIL
jgi:hypothetical protein